MPRSKLRAMTMTAVACRECTRASLILRHAHDSAEALLKAYDVVRGGRGGRSRRAPRGMSTDEEQDLLRAMLVMAAAGLDSMMKQLVRDALREVVYRDRQAQGGLERHISGRLKAVDTDFLSRVLASNVPPDKVVEEYIGHLTGGSLQSAQEVSRAASAFGLQPKDVGLDFEELRPIFEIRNKIIHELDINFETPRRVRTVRRADSMVKAANMLLVIGERILDAVDKKLIAAKR